MDRCPLTLSSDCDVFSLMVDESGYIVLGSPLTDSGATGLFLDTDYVKSNNITIP
jgi:hypothetical protein